MKFFFIPLVLVMAIAAVTEAKDPSKSAAKVRFIAESEPEDLGPVLLAAGEHRSAPFSLPVNNLSPAQSPPDRVFSLWAVDKNVSLAAITLPDDGKSFIVLLVTSPKGGYLPILIPAEDSSFRAGDVYFYNHADKPVLGYVGTAKFSLLPSQSTIVRPTGARAEKFYDVGLGVREPEGDRVLAATRWPEDHISRFYVFFYADPVTKRITYRAVDEFIPPPEKEH